MVSKRILSVCVVVVYSATQVVFATSPQVNLWKERKKTLQLAELPTVGAQLIPSAVSPLTIAPTLSSVAKSHRFSAYPKLAAILGMLPQNLGTIRKVLNPTQSEKIVLHIQDIHRNPEAQKNIEQVIRQLIQNKFISLVALEGAFGPIPIENFRSFPDQQSVRDVVAYYQRENEITGPMAAAFLSPVEVPRFVGIDHKIHYDANVNAYHASRFKTARTTDDLASELASLNTVKQTTFHKELLDFDRHVEAYNAGQLSMGDYVSVLAQKTTDLSFHIEIFLEALKIERGLDFKQVEKDREQVLARLGHVLSQSALSDLMGTSVAYRLGQLSHAEFYTYLKKLCQHNGLLLSSYPSLDRYVKYMALSGAIDADALSVELGDLEKKIYASLAKTDREKAVVQATRQYTLKKKISGFALSPAEWHEYKTKSLHGGVYEAFYREAEARDQAMASNLLTQLNNNNSKVAVLVTGGFHSPGIDKVLSEKGITVVSFAPRITKVESNGEAKYLSVFAQEKTPLEKLFEGPKLFVSPPVMPDANIMALAVAAQSTVRAPQGSPDTYFRKAITHLVPGLSRMVLLVKKSLGAVLVQMGRVTTEFHFDANQKLDSVSSQVIGGKSITNLFLASVGSLMILGAVVYFGTLVPVKYFPSLKTVVVVSAIVASIFLGMGMAMVPNGNAHRLFSSLASQLAVRLNGRGVPTEYYERREFMGRMAPLVQNWFEQNQKQIQEAAQQLTSPTTVLYSDPERRIKIALRTFVDKSAILDDTQKVGFMIPLRFGMYENIFSKGIIDGAQVELIPQGSHPLLKEKVASLEDNRKLVHQLVGEGQIIEILFSEPEYINELVPVSDRSGFYTSKSVRTDADVRSSALKDLLTWGELVDTMEDGTIVRKVESPKELPEAVRPFWKNHDGLFVIANEELGYYAFIGAHRFLPFEGTLRLIGGTRMIDFASPVDAAQNALFLSQDMSRKVAMAGLLYTSEKDGGVGGGKVAIAFDPQSPRKQEILESVARVHKKLEVIFTGQDMNISPTDAVTMAKVAPNNIIGPKEGRGGIPPTPPTAEGVYWGIMAGLRFAFPKGYEKSSQRISIQGAGGVGGFLIRYLLERTNSVVTVSDKFEKAINALRDDAALKSYIESGRLILLEAKDFEKIYDVPADIFSPCATQWTINENTIPRLIKAGVKYIAGSANDQIRRPQVGDRPDLIEYLAMQLHDSGILIAPDYVINGGGLIGVASQLFNYDVNEKLKVIHQNLTRVFEEAQKQNTSPIHVTDRIADELIEAVSGPERFQKASEFWKHSRPKPGSNKLRPLPALGLVKYAVGERRTLAQVVGELETRFGDVDYSNTGISEAQIHELNRILASLDVTDPDLQTKLVMKDGVPMTAVGLLPKSFRNKGIVLWAAGFGPSGSTPPHAHDSAEYIYEAFVPARGENRTDALSVQRSIIYKGSRFARLQKTETVTQQPNDGSVFVEQRGQAIHRNYNPSKTDGSWVILLYVRNVKNKGNQTTIYEGKRNGKNGVYRHNPAPRLPQSPNSHSGKKYIRDAFLEQFLIMPTTLLVVLKAFLFPDLGFFPGQINLPYILVIFFVDILMFWPAREWFLSWHKKPAYLAAWRVKAGLGQDYPELSYQSDLKRGFKRYYRNTSFGFLIFLAISIGVMPGSLSQNMAFHMAIAYGLAFFINALFHALENHWFFNSGDSRTDAERTGDAILSAAAALATQEQEGAVTHQLIGDIAVQQLGELYQKGGYQDQNPVDLGEVVRYIETKLRGQVEGNKLNFQTAQRMVQEISSWIGTPVQFNERRNIVVFARLKDFESLRKVFRLPDTYQIEVVVDGKEADAMRKRIHGVSHRPIEITTLDNLFSAENEFTRNRFESHLSSLLQRGTGKKWLLMYSKDIVYRLDNFHPMLDGQLAKFDYVALEEFVSETLGAIKVVPLNIIIKISELLSQNA